MARDCARLAVAEPQQCCPSLAAEPLSETEADERSKVFKALSDPRRLRLLSLIASAPSGEVCVCDLTGQFDVTAPTVSFHLRVLREAGLVESERRGTWVYYRVIQSMMVNLAGFFITPAMSID